MSIIPKRSQSEETADWRPRLGNGCKRLGIPLQVGGACQGPGGGQWTNTPTFPRKPQLNRGILATPGHGGRCSATATRTRWPRPRRLPPRLQTTRPSPLRRRTRTPESAGAGVAAVRRWRSILYCCYTFRLSSAIARDTSVYSLVAYPQGFRTMWAKWRFKKWPKDKIENFLRGPQGEFLIFWLQACQVAIFHYAINSSPCHQSYATN